ncbi:MAG TPA: lactonase family protein [Fimbriiglobus sp.]|jgi:6-phosphogluconolactonase
MRFHRLLFTAIFLALLSPVLPAADPDVYWTYFGTYTGGKSKGIYCSKFDQKTGTLTKPELAAEVTNPSFLWPHPTGKFLYAVGEVENLGKNKEGGVYAYSLDPKTGTLKKLNATTSGGADPCHISVDPAGTHAVVANYTGGSCAFFALKPDGEIGDRLSFHQHAGTTGPDKARQEAAHAHCGNYNPNGRYVYVCDLGLDRVKVYPTGSAHGGVSTQIHADIVMPPGTGPRHLAMTPKADFLFVCGELNSSVNVVKMEPGGATGTVIETLSTLPGGKPVKGNSTAEIALHPNGKFLYVSNRGHNTIATFLWKDGFLSAVGEAGDAIKTPRCFAVTPNGKWMLVASQDGDNVRVFEIDETTGVPKSTNTVVEVGKPVCVTFVPVAK